MADPSWLFPALHPGFWGGFGPCLPQRRGEGGSWRSSDSPHGFSLEMGLELPFPARNSPVKAAQHLPHLCPAQEPQGQVGVLGHPQFQSFGSHVPVLDVRSERPELRPFPPLFLRDFNQKSGRDGDISGVVVINDSVRTFPKLCRWQGLGHMGENREEEEEEEFREDAERGVETTKHPGIIKL